MYRIKIEKIQEPKRKVSQAHIDSMARDLDQNGQLNPLLVTDRQRIKNGVARYWAAKKLGWKYLFTFVEGGK